jgi:hypothetical protein
LICLPRVPQAECGYTAHNFVQAESPLSLGETVRTEPFLPDHASPRRSLGYLGHSGGGSQP